MKKLREILTGVKILSFRGDDNTVIHDITFDSRKVRPGSLFIAVCGSKSNGHDFIPDVVRSGATAVICEALPENAAESVSWVLTDDSAKALGIAAANFYGNPSSLIKLTGVTGTNGKTTIATLLYRLFTELGYRCGLFSTVCNYIIDRQLPATHTTPDPVQLNRLLAEMADAGCEYAFMEVSSHAIDQKRIAGLQFGGGIFTNLTHDHLDYHKSFDNYLRAKKTWFDNLSASAFALVNADDRNGIVMLQNCRARHYTYSVRGMADFRCRIIEQGFEGMGLKIMDEEVWTRFVGDYNASNLLAVAGAAVLLGSPKDEILKLLSNLSPVAGRMEVIRSDDGITGIVDYAHTPDALLNVIGTINKVRSGDISLITVVGAGGDRDRTKRPEMAAIAAEGSTRVILTSDNPRTEDPEKILDDMEAGIEPPMKKKTLRITDRRQAIRTAVLSARTGDVILVAGKGHEDYQEINGVKHHFDDREEVRKAFSQR
ncbi:MAG TPA: UDP-N-acetylmuramoyl-L-alanyl-D-glutamate--2,6-diaminopimelate ligase [Bacteroidales bacterium]|nr:UDP-N-acetylmuramoyl-L-alanyl-D-glutamate--2,6-diaminopimelate ligase [Bacteroidales bacterium]HPR12460.1 UDP-N-acetylmuramoyl-L-alanyl-D-glutamate--2,6-diaminopimelate ligase [Bacteroidales bacterium]HRW84525.1 UDP-N-acetylmuramoyl-L-alanyl-D-glutamate--2,6-diaminopimelate ligase [Bacteroidales bacterium]